MDAHDTLTWQAWCSIAVTVASLLAVLSNRVASDLAFLAALAVLVISGVLDSGLALAGFANRGLLTVAALFVVARALDHSGSMQVLAGGLLRWRGGQRGAMLRLMPPVALGSAFLNNTPLVALLLPTVTAWCARLGLRPSRLLIPLSYAAILGGLCTVIGTSTNLVVAGLWAAGGQAELGLFSIAALGVPVVVVALGFLVVVGPWLLPDRGSDDDDQHRSYGTQRVVTAGGPLVGRAVGEISGDQAMPMLPAELRRGADVIAAPGKQFHLQAGDILAFAGPSAALLDLHAVDGLEPVDLDQTPLPGSGRPEVHEVVIDASCPLLGQRVGDGSFRARYDAAVLALSRGGQTVDAMSQGWRLEAGDLLLVEGRPGFFERHGRGDGLWVVASHGAPQAVVGHRAWTGLLVLLLMVGCASLDLGVLANIGMLEASLAAAVILVMGGWLPVAEARRALDLHVLITIGAALGVGMALRESGAAAMLAQQAATIGAGSPWLSLLLIYACTVLLTECITNTAAAALMFPIALGVAGSLQVSPLPFVFSLMVAASASFATPLGYQTNLMVAGPGHYRVSDFLRIGLPMTVLVGLLTVSLAPLIWPF